MQGVAAGSLSLGIQQMRTSHHKPYREYDLKFVLVGGHQQTADDVLRFKLFIECGESSYAGEIIFLSILFPVDQN